MDETAESTVRFSAMDDLAALTIATAEFRRRLAEVGADQWDAPTPCSEWDVSALVRHVNLGNRMAELLLHGADGPTAVGPAAEPPAGVPALETYDITAAAQNAAFAEPGALVRVVSHPATEMPGAMFLMLRTLDITMHGWDLATALGQDADVDEALCSSLWTRLEPIAAVLPASGMFGQPEGAPPSTATAFEKVLHATGR